MTTMAVQRPVEGVAYARRGGLLVPADSLRVDLLARPEARPEAPDVEAPEAAFAPLDRGAEAPEAAPEPGPEKPVRQGRREAKRAARAEGRTKRVETLSAKAAEARHLRRLLLDRDVQAVQLLRQRARWTAMAWAALVFALAFTMVNVQRFAAGSADRWSPMWTVAWLVDPAFSVLLVGLLIARGQLSAVRRQVLEPIVVRVEYGLLIATTAMNIAPELTHRFKGGLPEQIGSVLLHLLVPLLAFGAASVLTVIQDHFSAAIDQLTEDADKDGRPVKQDGRGEAEELTEAERALLVDVQAAIERGELPPNPAGNAIYTKVMGRRGDRGRATKVAKALAGSEVAR